MLVSLDVKTLEQLMMVSLESVCIEAVLVEIYVQQILNLMDFFRVIRLIMITMVCIMGVMKKNVMVKIMTEMEW